MIGLLFWIYLVMSMITFAVYGVDKYKAQRGLWRIPEKTLHVLELCCGWPGAMLAHRFLRHKSYKKSFRLVFWCLVVVNVLGMAFCASRFIF